MLEFRLNSSKAASMPGTMAKVNLYLYVWKQREIRHSRRNRRRSRKRRFIKLRVFQVDERNRKGKRIAELRKRVHRSHWHRLGLPVSLVQSLWQAHNGTLKLRVKCKRCNKKVQLVMPSDGIQCSKGKKKKSKKRPKMAADKKPGATVGDTSSLPEKTRTPLAKKSRTPAAGRKRMRSLRTVGKCGSIGRRVPGHIPFMVIENKSGGWPTSRKKTHSTVVAAAPSTASSHSSILFSPSSLLRNVSRHTRSALSSSFMKTASLQRSMSSSSAVPKGVRLERSVWGVSLSASDGHRQLPSMSSPLEQPVKARYGRSVSDSSTSETPAPVRVCNPHPRSLSCCVVALPVDPNEFDVSVSIVAPSTLTLTACEGQCHNHIRHNRRRMRLRGSRRRGGKRRKSRSCEPVDSQPLEIWYFDYNHNLAHASLPDMVITQCGCRRN